MLHAPQRYHRAKKAAINELMQNKRFKLKLGKKSQELYIQCLARFFNKIKKHPKSVTELDIENYLVEYKKFEKGKHGYTMTDKQAGYETLKSNKNAILKYYNGVLRKNFLVSIYIKKKRKVFSIVEIEDFKRMLK